VLKTGSFQDHCNPPITTAGGAHPRMRPRQNGGGLIHWPGEQAASPRSKKFMGYGTGSVRRPH
jgi:hypothetical protein